MSVNLNDLDLMDEPIELTEDYQDAQEFPPPLPKGEYLLTSGEPDFSPTNKDSNKDPQTGKARSLKANLIYKVAQGEFEGREIREFSLSNKHFERNGAKVSQMKDHLRATGDRTNYSTDRETGAALVNAQGKVFKAKVDWEARTRDLTKPDKKGVMRPITVRGEGKFPLVDGKRNPEIEIGPDGVVIPTGSPDSGKGEICRAFSVITFRQPA